MIKLKEKGIITQVHYIPVTSHPYYENLNYRSTDYLTANNFYKNCITLPLYFSLSNNDQDFVINELIKLINK